MPVTKKDIVQFDPSKYGAVEVKEQPVSNFDPSKYGAVEVKKKDGTPPSTNGLSIPTSQLQSGLQRMGTPQSEAVNAGGSDSLDYGKLGGQVGQASVNAFNSGNDFGFNTFNKISQIQRVSSDNTKVASNQTPLTLEEQKQGKNYYTGQKVANAAFRQQAIKNTVEKSLKNQGINAPEGSPIYNQELDKYTAQNMLGLNHVAADENGTPGLKRTIGWAEGLSKGWNDATKGDQEADLFANKFTPEQKVEYLKLAGKNEPTEYIGERNDFGGSLGHFLGGSAPFLGKAAAGAALGTAAVMAAPESGGLSLEGLPVAASFIMTAPDMANHGVMDETVRRYQILKSQHPERSDVDNMKEAEQGTLAGGITGILTNAALMGLGGGEIKPLSAESKSVLGNTLKGTLKASVNMGTSTAALEAAKELEGNLEGVKTNVSDVIKNTVKSFSDNATTGLLLHSMMHTLPNIVKSGVKYALKDSSPQEVTGILQANEQAGNVSPGTTDKVVKDITDYQDALSKTAKGLTPETQASVAGLIQKRTNIEQEAKTKDVSAQPVYKEQVDAINNQISEIQRTGKPLEYEIDETTGETYAQPTYDKVAEQRVKDLADKISKGKPVEDAEDLQTEHRFPEQLKTELDNISKEEKKGNSDKEKPNTELSDNIKEYFKKTQTEPILSNTEETPAQNQQQGGVVETSPISEKIKTTDYKGQHQLTEIKTNASDLQNGGTGFDWDHVSEDHDLSDKSTKESYRALKSIKDNPDADVTIYRSVPKDINVINKGDWITLSKNYATEHGMDAEDAGKDAPVISMKVKAKDISWDGNDLNEFVYHPQETENSATKPSVILPQENIRLGQPEPDNISSPKTNDNEQVKETNAEKINSDTQNKGAGISDSSAPLSVGGNDGNVTGVKKSITEPLRAENGLPKVNLPKMGKDVDSLNAAKARVDSGESNPRELVNRILDDKNGFKNENEVFDLQYYAHQLNAKTEDLKRQHSEAETAEDKAKISGHLQQLSDETDRYTEAAQTALNKWGKIGNASQVVVDDGFNPSREKLYIKDAFGGNIPKDFQERLDRAIKERDDAIAAKNKAESELSKAQAQKEVNKNKVKSDTKKTHDDFVKDRQKYIAELKDAKDSHEKWLKDNGIQQSGVGFTLTTDMLKAVGKIIRSYAEEGLQKAEEIAEKVYHDVKDIFDGISKKDVIDIMAGRYNVSAERTDFAKQVAEIRKQAKQISDANLTKDERTKKEVDRLNKKADAIEKNISEGKILESKKSGFTPERSNDWVRANQRVIKAEHDIRKMKNEAFLSQKNMLQKGMMWASKLVRGSVLSGTNVLYKLASAAAIGGAVKRLPEQAFGAVWSNIYKGIAREAPIEGFINAKSEVGFYKNFFNPETFLKNAWEIAKTHSSPLNKKMGESFYDDMAEITMPGKQKTLAGKIGKTALNVADRTLTFPLDVHQMIKEPIKRATYEASLHNGLVWAEKNGLDINDPLIIHSAEVAAYKRANYEIFQEKRWLSKKFNEWKNELDKSGTGGSAAKLLVDFMLPVSTVPTNIAARVLSTSPLGMIRGQVKVINAYRKGIENLQPEQADAIMRQLKQGSLGTALWLTGWFGAASFGGLYNKFNPDKKRQEGDLMHDQMEVGGEMLPKYAQHAVPFEIIQMAATMRHIYDHYKDKGSSDARALLHAGLGSIGAIMEQIPIIETGAHLAGATKNPYEADRLTDDMKRRFEPQILRETGVISK